MGDDMLHHHHHQREPSREGASSILGLTMLQEPVVEEKAPDRVAWEYHSVSLSRVPGYGFGIAVSGGRDNPHFANGDPAIAISDVLKSGPAEGKLLVNDRILSANGVSLENVDYATAVQVLRDNSTVQLVVKRRVLLQPEVQAFRVSLSRTGGAGRKSDFGLNLSTKLYIKDLQVKTSSLQEGDVVIRINNTPCEGMSLKEAKKLIENTKDKLQLVVKREGAGSGSGGERQQQPLLYSSQNLYVQPPRRASEVLGPQRGELQPIPPPRPPPPIDESIPSDYCYSPHQSSVQSRPRLISFVKQGPLGIRLAGGNAVGIFVTAVQPGSQALVHGLSAGDKILQVNNKDMVNFTREEAVNLLMSLNDEVKLLVHHNPVEYENVIGKSLGDFFYIKTQFTYEKKGELAFKVGDIFQVTDTLVNGSLGYWGVIRYTNGEKGIVPNMIKATEISVGSKSIDGSRSFFRKKKEVVKFDPYERVVLKHPGFMRPVVILGSVGDIARERLTLEHPDVFSSPAQDSHSSKMIKMSSIREIISRGQHAILDVSPSIVEKLNYAQLYPIVVLLKVDTKKSLKDIRGLKSGHGTLLGRKSPRKLLSVSSKLESTWFHIITNILTVSSEDNWLRKVKEGIDKEQGRSIWVAEEGKPPSSDDCVFPLQPSTRNSYASSPESDVEMEKDHVNGKSSHSAGIELPNYNEPPAYSIASQPFDKQGQQEMYPMLPMSSSQQKILLDKSIHLDHSPPDSPGCPPPLVDRSCKPKSATERLFGEYGSRDTIERVGHRKGSSNGNHQGTYDSRPYDHHDVYRFTRSTAQPLGRENKGSYSPYRTLEEGGSNGNGNGQQLYNNYKKDFNGSQETYNYKDIHELKHLSSLNGSSSSPFKSPSDIYQKSGDLHQLYNNTSRSSPASAYKGHNYSPYRGALDSNGNPYGDDGSSPYKPPPPPKVKPVPPPKPIKPARTDLNGTNGNNSFYLNVPVNMGSRGISAFEVYGKDTSTRRSDHGIESTSILVLPEAGGILECCGVKVIIPAGALESPQEIQLQIYENTYSSGEGSGNKVLSPLVKLSPEGLKFQIPVELILPPSFYPMQNRESLCSNGNNKDAEGLSGSGLFLNSTRQVVQDDSSIRLLLDRF